jgi:signal transduction histidine kinase
MQDAGTPRFPPMPPTPVTARGIAGWLWRELRIGVPICIATAVFLELLLDDAFARLLVYSLCIGLSIPSFGEVLRHATGRWRNARSPQDTSIGPRGPGRGWMAPIVVLSTLGGHAFGITLADTILGHTRTQGVFGGGRALLAVLIVCLVVALGAVYFFHSRARLALLREDAGRASRAAAEAQLRLLLSQLEPHMLFNTLANLRVLIGSDPPRAELMLNRLIGFLRATLAASRHTEHTLAEEFDRLADFLSLMAVRMGQRLQVEFHLPDELRSASVPTLLLQPLVENSIRHGLEPRVLGGRVIVRARSDGDALVLTVSDTGVGLAGSMPPTGSGFGLTQVRKRLAHVYGDRAVLRIEPADGDGVGTRVSVRLPRPV